MQTKVTACRLGALLVFALLAGSQAAAQDDDIREQVERAFVLLGLDQGGPATTDPARIAEGLPLLEAAAAAGEGVAENALGMAYANGFFGLDIDIPKALAFYQSAMSSETVGEIAKLNWALAQYAVGDPALAVPRLEEVYASGAEVAPYAAPTLAEAYALGKGVARDMPRAGVLYEEVVARDPANGQAHYMLGRGYEAGFFDGGVQTERSLRHYQSAAELGDPRAAWKIGMAHLNAAPGFEGGSTEAYAWVRRSAEGGWVDGMISTAVMLATGDGVEQDASAAARWYSEAATQGSPHAMRGLGAMHYFDELGPESDRALGVALIELGAEGGDETASSILDAIEDEIRDIDRVTVETFKTEWRQKAASSP